MIIGLPELQWHGHWPTKDKQDGADLTKMLEIVLRFLSITSYHGQLLASLKFSTWARNLKRFTKILSHCPIYLLFYEWKDWRPPCRGGRGWRSGLPGAGTRPQPHRALKIIFIECMVLILNDNSELGAHLRVD